MTVRVQKERLFLSKSQRTETLGLPLAEAGNFRAQILSEIPSTDPVQGTEIHIVYFTVEIRLVVY